MKGFALEIGMGIGLLAFAAAGVAVADSGGPAGKLHAPQNINAEPASPESSALSTAAAQAEMAGSYDQAIRLADQAIRKTSEDPWPYYDKATALAQTRRTDDAVAAFQQAEARFSSVDTWGKSVAIYGRAHALAEVGRCDEARQAFLAYADLVQNADVDSAALARRYADACSAPRQAPQAPQPSAPGAARRR